MGARFGVLTCVWCVVGFEGQAHPYKENIVRLGGAASMVQIPEVKAAFAQQASAAQ